MSEKTNAYDDERRRLRELIDEATLLASINRDLGALAELTQRVTAAERREQANAEKWREKVQTIENELRIAQKGMSSGCGCPIGKCQRRLADTGGCWLQWAESYAMRQYVSRRMDSAVLAGNHPSRFVKPPLLEKS